MMDLTKLETARTRHSEEAVGSVYFLGRGILSAFRSRSVRRELEPYTNTPAKPTKFSPIRDVPAQSWPFTIRKMLPIMTMVEKDEASS